MNSITILLYKKLSVFISMLSKYVMLLNKDYIIYSLILLTALSLRLYKINTPLADWHSFRQVDTASVARIYEGRGIDLLHPIYHDISRVQSGIFNPEGFRFVEFPIYNALVAVLSKNLQFFTLEVWGRLISVYLSLLGGVLLFKIAKKLFDVKVSYISLFTFAVMPFSIYFSRVFLPEPLAVFFTLSFLYLFLQYEGKNQLKLVASAVFLSLAILTKPYVVFFGLPAVAYFYQKHGSRKFLKSNDFWFFSVLTIMPFVLWRSWIARFPEGIPFWKWVFNGDGIRFNPAYWYWIYGERIGKLILGVWGVIPFFIGVVSLKKKDYFTGVLLLGVFAYLLLVATANVRHDYYQTLIIPFVVIAFSLGVKNLYQMLRISTSKIIAGVSMSVICLLSMAVSAFQVKEYYKINHPEIISAGNAVDRLAPNDAKVIASYNGDTAFLYFTKRFGWPVVELPIEQLIEEGASYYASVNLNDSQTIEFMKRFEIMEKKDSYVVLKLQ